MSQIEVLPPVAPSSQYDYDPTSISHSRSIKQNLINGFLSTSPTNGLVCSEELIDKYIVTCNNDSLTDDLSIASLPPLFNGHPDIHLRNGVIKAGALAAAGEPDAEKAFFVSDLSEVYKQHLRWKKCLPFVEPFYGASN